MTAIGVGLFLFGWAMGCMVFRAWADEFSLTEHVAALCMVVGAALTVAGSLIWLWQVMP